MAIQQTKKQSDLEKRLQLLRRQVYGKDSDRPEYQVKSVNQKTNILENMTSSRTSISSVTTISDLSYLHHDLLKILIFSSLAIGVQIVLFILSSKHILNLNFF